jgi:preprotein translocase subunit SecD
LESYLNMQRTYQNIIITIILVVIAVWIVWPDNPGVHVLGINKDFRTVLGLDLRGGVQALLEADLPANAEIDSQSMSTAVRIVENRVNGLGVSEAVVQQAGDRRIVVELPGHEDPETALAALKQTGLLEFVDMSEMDASDIFLLEQNGTQIITDYALDEEAELTEPLQIFKTIMTGAVLRDARVTTNEAGRYEVAFELNSEGANIFKEYSGSHIGQILAIVLDKQIISAPSIQTQIPDGKGVISGSFTYDEANTLAVQLRYGALPIPLKVVETRSVGPTLGQESLEQSLIAGLIGFAVVIMFMVIYYRLPGIVAVIAILIYAVITFAIFRYIPVTLTLAGIAGFLLSTGSALDANILIFERMKEELRSGKSVQNAITLGWQRAWTSIRDSNIATLITCFILFWFGSQFGATIVKGFSITLALGVLVSVFTAIVVTRAFLTLLFHFYTPKNITKWFGL